MRVGKSTLIKVAAGAVALLLTLALLLSAINWNFAKPWITERVQEATGRSFSINGDLRFSWQRPEAVQSGWRRFLPWPHLQAQDLSFGNPDWATTGPTMATMTQIDFTLHPLMLFRKTMRVSSLLLTEPDLVLEIGEDGRNNWAFEKRDPESEWELDLRELSLRDGTVRLVDSARKADVRARIDTLEDGSVTWNISGRVDEDKVSGAGKAGALLSLQDHDTAYPLQGQLQIGDTEISAEGTLTGPRRPTAIDIDLKIQGASMAQLFAFTGMALPETPRFSTEGRVVGSLAKKDFHLRYEDFTGKVGASDIGGTLEYLRQAPRPSLRGEVVSNRLNIHDLDALLSIDSEEERKKRGDTVQQPPDKVLPVAPFRTERWENFDAQVKFTAKKILRRDELPIDNLSANVQLDDGVLTLAPLNFGVAGGRLRTDLTIDGNSDPAKATLDIRARGLKLRQLFPKVEEMRASLGEFNGDAKLSSAGNSFAALAGAANGEVKAFISEGTVSKFILEAIGLNLGSVILTQLFGDHQVQLNCLASDFKVADGMMQTRTFVVDTEDALISVDGKINLGSENLDLTIYPQSKGVRILSLRAPLHVAGSFQEPEVAVDKGAVGLRAGAAAALGAVAAPLAALLALIEAGPEEERPCAKLLAQAKEKPTAPPPEKAAVGK